MHTASHSPADRLSAPEIPAAEFRARQNTLAAKIGERGLAAVVVWSLGGQAHELFGDVLYLSNHHAMMPRQSDMAAMTAAGFSALVLRASGESVLLTTTLGDVEGGNVADDVRLAPHLPQAVVAALQEFGLDQERIGIVGADTLLESHARILREPVPRLESVDEILVRMRAVKSPAELEMMRHAAKCGCRWMGATMAAAEPGRTEAEIIAEGYRQMIVDGGVPYGVASAGGKNSQYVWGSARMPSWNSRDPLQAGDMFHVDLWGPVGGYLTDFSRTTVIGGEPDPSQLKMIDGAAEAVEEMCAVIKPGVTMGAIFDRGVEVLVEAGFVRADGTSESGESFLETFPLLGHSLGHGLDTPWIIAGEPWEVEPGMVLAVEATVESEVGGAAFEHNLIVQDDGLEIMTASSPAHPWQRGG